MSLGVEFAFVSKPQKEGSGEVVRESHTLPLEEAVEKLSTIAERVITHVRLLEVAPQTNPLRRSESQILQEPEKCLANGMTGEEAVKILRIASPSPDQMRPSFPAVIIDMTSRHNG